MKIQSNYTMTTFMAKGKIKYTPTQLAQAKDTFCKNDIYVDIEKYLSKDINKKEFLKEFKAKTQGQEYTKNLSRVEQKYINDIKMTMELMNNFDEITDKYLIDRVKKLLEAHKK